MRQAFPRTREKMHICLSLHIFIIFVYHTRHDTIATSKYNREYIEQGNIIINILREKV